MSTTSALRLPGTPPRWVNRSLEFALKVPGVRSLVGRSFALITVTGARSGHRYSTPVQYVRDGERYVVTSQRHRLWWRNIDDHPEVELVVRGRRLTLPARVAAGDESFARLTELLTERPKVAKFYGVGIGDDGTPDPDGCHALDEAVVVIVIGEPG